MNRIDKEKYDELLKILSNLLETIKELQKTNGSYLLKQNMREALEWYIFMEKHSDAEAIELLQREISDRLFFSFDVQIEDSELDRLRTNLMKMFIRKSCECLK